MRKLILLITSLICLSASAQKQKIGDFIESTSYNLDKIGVERRQQYFPERKGFVTINGENRYTRALYGSHTDWRLETSDRPIFAVVKKDHHRNIRFELDYQGKSIPLEKVSFCKAHYAGDTGGARFYALFEQDWIDSLGVVALASPDRERAIWMFFSPAMKDKASIRVIVSPIVQPKLHRNGDIGADKPGCLEPADTILQEFSVQMQNGVCYLAMDLDEIKALRMDEGYAEVKETLQYYFSLSSRIQFDTPDPYINSLGSALVLAADGDWDGQTWLHGCIGWRMPLAGWRAGYLGDVLGWNDRAVSHFDAYAKSQVIDVQPVIPHPSQES